MRKETQTMKVKDAMTSKVTLVSPAQTIREAAKLMIECDAGALPVAENDRLVGMLTDRDIVIRAVANNRSPDTPVREVMSEEVLYCFDDEDVEDVAENMGDQQVRRLLVLSREKQLVGIVSVGDLARRADPEAAGEAVAEIARPGGMHDQVKH
jgi:CBS domain-containing protein